MYEIPQIIKEKALSVNETVVVIDNISWDLTDVELDGAEVTADDLSLPSGVVDCFDLSDLQEDEIEDFLCENLTNYYGFCVNGFTFTAH